MDNRVVKSLLSVEINDVSSCIECTLSKVAMYGSCSSRKMCLSLSRGGTVLGINGSKSVVF